jgi:hypothetical protein
MKREATSYIGHIICDRLPTIERYTLLAPDTVAVTGFTGNGYAGQNWIYFSNGSATTVADMKTWLASNPLQVVYELATPTEITLTPTEVKTLLGQNNIWADSGNVYTSISTENVTYKITGGAEDVQRFNKIWESLLLYRNGGFTDKYRDLSGEGDGIIPHDPAVLREE